MTEIYDSQFDSQFEFTYAPGTSTEQIIGFEMAGVIWSSYLDDDVTVRIYVESTDQLPDEVIGAALPGKKKKKNYDKIREKLFEDITSDNDLLAFNNLPSNDNEFSVVIDGVELDETKEFRLTNANAKSLGILNDDRNKLDGYIVVNDLTGNSTVGWDYDALRSDNIQGNEIDFLSVAMHEVGHILGFTSGIDDDGWLEVLAKSQEEEKELKGKDFKFATALDLYRYSDSTADMGMLDLSTGGNPYFSIDGGNTNLGNFANGEYTNFGGDGYQASHWQQGSSQGIMNPILPVGERKDISQLDITAMDVIGWDINTSNTLSWSEMYDVAVDNADDAMVEDLSEDVEKMIKESKYDGRPRRRSSSVDFSFQIGYWQYTTFDSVDVPDVITEDELEPNEELDTEIDLENELDVEDESNPENELDVEDELEPNEELDTEIDPENELDVENESNPENELDVENELEPNEELDTEIDLENELDVENESNPENELDAEDELENELITENELELDEEPENELDAENELDVEDESNPDNELELEDELEQAEDLSLVGNYESDSDSSFDNLDSDLLENEDITGLSANYWLEDSLLSQTQ